MKRYMVGIVYYFDADNEEHALAQFLDSVDTSDPNVLEEVESRETT